MVGYQGLSRFFSAVGIGLLVLFWGFLPTQLGKHFWPPFSLVNGIRVDYLAPTLYLTDLIALSLILVVLLKQGLPKRRQLVIGTAVALVLLLPLIWVSSPWLHFLGWVKLVELVGLFWAVRQVRLSAGKKLLLCLLIVIGLSLLVVAQTQLQRSVGGWAYWLGERRFTAYTPGIAQAEGGGGLRVRPPATFSHPNSLAGFLVVLWWLAIDQFTLLKKSVASSRVRLGLAGGGLAAAISLLLTWSRTAWVVAFITLGLAAARVWRRPIRWGWITGVALGLAWFFPLVVRIAADLAPHLTDQESFSLRDQLFTVGTELIARQPVWGVGLKGFVPSLGNQPLAVNRAFLQPIHNGFWLIGTEAGFVGLVLVLWGILKGGQRIQQQKRWGLWLALLTIILTSANDHYWVTLQQNQLLVVLVAAEAWSRIPVSTPPKKE